MTRQVNAAGVALVKEFEGCKLLAYKDGGGIWTIGYGHTGGGIHAGLTISQDTADRLLVEDLQRAAEIVEDNVKAPLNDNQFAALSSFVFNVGPGAEGVKSGFVTLANGSPSTMLKLLNDCKFSDAALQFPLWNRVAGVASDGLTRRRLEEQALFSTPAPGRGIW